MAVPSPSPAAEKRAVRATARSARQALALPRPVIAPVPAFTALLTPGMVVASYVPVGAEADPGLLADAARAAGCHIALPHVVDQPTPLRFLARGEEAPLVSGPFGLLQPAHDREELAPDLILAPLVAFDRALGRLGQGGGHYDRAFAAYPAARRIGVAFSVQAVDRVPTDPWDMPLHAIITEREWITA
ncbi:5-formyltetrahydrofolate cyclo-ligase [Sphingomonas dokdonensis]|uniref:5-formyltetrahydrofolate cyclo-ligase n=1 Tax=Sphingomonas dokdonensis TaxID=344880 RepID=A0A245ZUA2_9SPHN|nr:5-formyltetrahydrofolate cyclo-ligase [Sphingomonas dokdonensis]OWK33329.1 putative 5-formyltetrahydrofolate cyclo-ligase [Sphingomonas dokdonensis]